MDQRLIEEYNVVSGTGTLQLARNIRIAIEDGWQPFGGVSFDESRNQFHQAVVKYAPPPRQQSMGPR